MATDDPYRYVSLPNGDPLYEGIGLVASHWARLERTADHAIWELMQAEPPLSACVTAQIMGFGPRVRSVMALHSQLHGDESDHKKLRRLMNDSFELQQERNRVIHDPWYYNPARDLRARYAATTGSDGKPVLDFIPVTLNDLRLLAGRISTFEERAHQTFEDVLKPFRDNHRGWFSIGRIE